MANCSDLHPDPNNEEDDDNDYDRIVFEGNAGHEPVEGFTGVLHGVTDGGLPPPFPVAAAGSLQKMYTTTLMQMATI